MESDMGDPIHREVRDGVPVFWTPKAPRVIGALMFRAGFSDESVTLRGVSHIVEHLALYGTGARPTHEVNGFVDSNRTVFWASGTAEQVVALLKRVCGAFTDLPLHRLEAESRVLRTEATSRQSGLVDRLLWYRFGARGHGLACLPEFLLGAPDPVVIREWSAERFTIENATAWFSGPLPDDLRFDLLSRGRRFPCAEPVPISGLQTPAYLRGDPGGVALSLVTERDDWIGVPWRVATERLMSRLRFDAGVTYSVQCALHPISDRQIHSVIWADCLEEQAMTVREGLLDSVEELARTGPTDAELEEFRKAWTQHAGREEGILERLDHAALNELMGHPVLTQEELRDEFDRRTSARWSESVQRALRTAILLLPPSCTAGRSHFMPYPTRSDSIATGRTYRAIAQRFPWSRKQTALVVGKQGVSVVTPEGEALTVTYDRCAGAAIRPDGTLQLFGEDGTVIAIAAHEWRAGEHARSEALRSLPPDRVIHLQEG